MFVAFDAQGNRIYAEDEGKYSLMLLSYNLNNQVDEEGRGWTVRNGKLFYIRPLC